MGHGSSTVDGASAPCIKSEQMKARLPAKASDYGLERFNRLLERLDRGNFLIKTSFKKSYSLILMSARGSIPAGDPSGAGVAGGVESSGNDSTASTNTANGDSKTDGSGRTVGCNSSSISNSSNSSTGAPSSGTSGPGASFKRLQQQTDKRPLGGSLRGWYPRTRGILIKANSSTGIYQLAGVGRAESATLAQVDNHHQQFVSHAAPSTEQSPTERRTPGQRKAVPGADLPEATPTNTTAASGHNYNGNSLAPDDSVNGDGPAAVNAGSEKDHRTNNESDELCRSEVYDNDSGSGSGGRAEQLLNNRAALRTSPRKANVEPCRNNYENIRPSTHRSRQRLSSLDGTNHTVGPGTRKPMARKKSNTASTGSEWDEDSWMPHGQEDGSDGTEHKLSSSFPHTSSGYYWQSTECPVPTRFFQRQDYVQPATTDSAALDFPLDRSYAPTHDGGEQDADRDRGSKRTQAKKRWLGGSKGGKNKTLSTVVLDADSTDIKTTVGNKDTADHPFQLTSLFGTGSHSGNHGRKRQERVPQLKNINLHFPNKTSHQQQQQQQQHHGYDEQTQHELRSSRAPTGNIPPGALFHQPTGYHQLSLPPQTVMASHRHGASGRGERKYFNKAKSHFLKLGQKWRLLTVSGGKARATHRTGTGHQQQHQQQQHHISSYNLDDLIKATHRYGQENESANLSQKIVYKSYKSELDLTKNLAYLDSFLNEHFDQDGDRPRTVGRYSRHKRAKSCSKTLDPSLKAVALGAGRVCRNTDELAGMAGEEDPATDSTLEATAVTVPFGCVSSNLIQLEDVWEGTGRNRGQWVTTNTSSSSSEYLRNNLSTARTSAKPNVKANKMRDFFRFDGAPGGVEDATYGKVKAGEGEDEEEDDEDDDEEEEEEDDENLELEDDDDARMLLFDSLAPFIGSSGNGGTPGPVSARTIQGAFVEQYGKNNATSSSLSSSDYASVYSATSSGGNGATSTPGPTKSSLHGTQFKLLATPEEGTAGEGAPRVDCSPQKHHQSSPKQQRAHHLPRMNVMPGNNVTNPFVTLSAGEGPAGNASHRIYNNFLDGSPRHQASVPGSPADKPVEKNHRLRKPQTSSGLPAGRLPSTGSVSPRGTDRYDYRMQQPKPSNSRSHFRQMVVPVALDTDLTYQEDYLEHYQNAARARSLQGGHGDTDPSLHFLHQGVYHRRRSALPVGGSSGEDLQNNALANENSDNDTDEDSRMQALVKTGDGGSIVDDVATTDELLLLVNAAIDIRRSQAVEQPLLLGNARKKNTRKELQRVSTQIESNRRVANEPLSDSESVANESKTLLAYRPQAQPQYDPTSNQLYNGEFRSAAGTAADSPAPGVTGARRTFGGLNHPPNGAAASSKSGSAIGNSYLGYGPHRVIVSQSRKERGEVVLEYEC